MNISSERGPSEIEMFKAQAIPVVGFVVSAAIALVNLVQVVALGVFVLYARSNNSEGSESELYKNAVIHLKDGGINLGYSVANLCSLGIFGFCMGLTEWAYTGAVNVH